MGSVRSVDDVRLAGVVDGNDRPREIEHNDAIVRSRVDLLTLDVFVRRPAQPI